MDRILVWLIFGLLCLLRGVCEGVAKSLILIDEQGTVSARFVEENEANRTWLLMAAEDKVIKLEIVEFSASPDGRWWLDYEKCSDIGIVYLEIIDGDISLGQFCLKHAIRTYVSKSSSIRLHFSSARQKAYTSDSTINKGHFVATFTHIERSNKTCGFERITDQSGTINYPGNALETTYPDNVDCTWQLIPSAQKNVQLNISSIDIQFHANCSYDYLEVYDVFIVYGKLCGTQGLPPVTSNHQPLLVFFHSDSVGQGRGFVATYTEVDKSYQSCGDLTTLTAPSGFVRSPSPGKDGLYAYSTHCNWVLLAADRKVIVLEIVFLNLPIPTELAREGCTYLYGYFYFGYGRPTGYYRELLYGVQVINDDDYYHFCGSHSPPSITSKGQTLQIAFSFVDTLGNYEPFIPLQGKGFNATYVHMDEEEACSFFTVQRNGIISVENEGERYKNNMDCSWVVWTNHETGEYVQIYFNKFDIPSNADCQHDYLEVYDGASLIGVYCGSIPPPLITAHHYLLLKFHSNKRVRGKGFSGIYKIIDRNGLCGGISTELAGEIIHEGWHSQYLEVWHYVCEWLIIVPEYHRIQLKFISIDFPETDDCRVHHVKVSDEAHLSEAFCGSQLPELITTSSSIMNITMTASYDFIRFRHKGFKAVYSGIYRDCGGILTLPASTIQFIDDVNRDMSDFDVNCIWIISGPENSIIEVDIVNISLSDRNDCTNDFLKVFDSRFAEEARLWTTCGRQPTPATNWTSSLLYLQFAATNQPNNWTGFQAKYITHVTLCGGFLNTAPAYFSVTIGQKNKTDIGNCRWHIQAKQDKVVELKILRIYLTEMEECNTEFIKVYDGGSDEADLIARYCGTDLPPILVSSGRDMYVHFHSEYRTLEAGFEAIYAESNGAPLLCGNMLSGNAGHFQSPDHDNDGNYDNGLKCDWTIITEPGSIVKLVINTRGLEADPLCRFDRMKVFDGTNVQSPLFGIYCWPKPGIERQIFRGSSNAMHVQFISDNSLNDVIFRVNFTSSIDAWKAWPDGDYSIPMSIYGCPEQDINNWRQGYINITSTVPFDIEETSVGVINQHHDLFTLGPIGRYSIQLNFCTKMKSNKSSGDAEWPRGIYAIFKSGDICPEGFRSHEITFATGDFVFNNVGMTPKMWCGGTFSGLCTMFVYICMKLTTDAVTLSTDFREPFVVISPKILILSSFYIGLIEANETTMLSTNSSMTVVVETFAMIVTSNIKMGITGKWLAFWMITPKDTTHLFLKNGGIIDEVKLSPLALGLPPADSEEENMWLAYDLGRAVLVTGIRLLRNDEYAASDDISGPDIPTILVSNQKWHHVNHGAWHCLPYQIIEVNKVDVFCANHRDYLTVRYVTLKEKGASSNVLKKLRLRIWSVWILSDNSYSESLPCRENLGLESGFLEDFQITKSSKTYRQSNNDDLIHGQVWCFPKAEVLLSSTEYFQIDLLQPTKIEEIVIQQRPKTFHFTFRVYILYSNFLSELSATLKNQSLELFHKSLEMDSMMAKYVYSFDSNVTARYLKVAVRTVEFEVCLSFELLGCMRSNLKSIQRNNKTDCQLLETRLIHDTYFYEEPALTLTNVTADECLSACTADATCSVVYLGTNCTWLFASPSNSYSSVVVVGRNDIAFMKVCPTDESYKTSVFISGNLTWNDITTMVRNPGIIVSHDYPFRYSSGQLWCWKIFFNTSITVNLILYNTSFDRYQVYKKASDNKIRFHDYIDRLFITSATFDANMFLTDGLVDETKGVIAVVDRTREDNVAHYITDLETVKLYWRTVVQGPPSDPTAAGFRLLAYPSRENICHPFTNCESTSAVVRSKSVMGDFASNNEMWHISSDVNGYIFLQFDAFDIGCQGDTVLEVAISLTEKQTLCNLNKPFSGLKSQGNQLTITISLTRKDSYLIEGFEARYSTLHKPQIDTELLSKDETVFMDLSGLQSTRIFEVCSGQFEKCYLLIGDLQNIYRQEITSWSFVGSEICSKHNWTMLSLHSKLEQDFIGYMLLSKFVHTNQARVYIGLKRGIASYSAYEWIDKSPVTFTSWARGHPSPDLYMRCAAMTLSLSNDYTWESIPCDEAKTAMVVCQYDWTSTITDQTQGQDSKEPETTRPGLQHPYEMPTTSLFNCSNTEVISILGRCDNVTDCLDGSDELDCIDTSGSCTPFEFRCGDGLCVSISVLCDNRPDCTDQGDEDCYFPQCDMTEFRCSNHKCIPLSQRCDGKIDCFDESDEVDCAFSDCNDKNSFLCSSTYCIPRVFVCDGIPDCMSGVDELNCQIPESCQEWWNAGYHNSGMYEAGPGYIECNFEQVLSNNRIITKFYNIDYGRLILQTERNVITYSTHDILVTHLHKDKCYLTVDQLCQSWVQRLFNIDERQRSQEERTKTLHACQCLRYGQALMPDVPEAINSTVTGCDGRDVYTDEVFHIEFNSNSSNGLLESFNLKPGHEFDVGMSKLHVHPIICHTDFQSGASNIACGFGFTTAQNTRCLYREDQFGHIVGCRSLKHLQNCETFSCPANYLKCPKSFCVERRYVCDGVIHCLKGEDEVDCDKMLCLSEYRCMKSNICLQEQYVCDGYPQCPYGDDERLCNFTCPKTCSCRGFSVSCTNGIDNGRMKSLTIPAATRMLDISGNSEAWRNISFTEDNVVYLIYLNVSACGIRSFPDSIFSFMKNLRILDLSWNFLVSLPSRLFESQTNLKFLRFVNNMELLTIHSEAFLGLESIVSLSLNHLKIERVRPRAFESLNLHTLDLTQNIIHYCEDNAFATLHVENLFLNQSIINEMSSGLFKGIQYVSLLVADSVKYCCVKPYFLSRENCLPPENKISSCDDLLSNGIIRTLALVVGLITIIANSLSFIYRLHDRDRLRSGYGIFVTNLSISDFAMGVYLLIIAGADMEYRSSYYMNDETWRKSWACQLAGVLALLSTETSVLFICLITIDRLLVIKFPFGNVRMTKKPSLTFVFVAWLTGLFAAVFPVVYKPYFRDDFYSKSSVCLALPLSKDRPSGWQYSVLIFIGFNCVTFLLIAAGQWLTFNEVTTSSRNVTSKSRIRRKKELRVARNLFVVALTNFLCWAPVALLGAVALGGTEISGEIYAWVAVFVLPINSALNPFLYTLSAILKKEAMVPEKDEHEKTLTFPRDDVDEFFRIWRNKEFFMNRKDGYEPLSSLLNQDRFRLCHCVQIAKEILKLLHKLHVRAIAQKALVVDDIFIQLSSNGMWKVALDSRPELATKGRTKAENVKSFGHILSSLLDACKNDPRIDDS